MKHPRHIIKMYKYLNYKDKETMERHYEVLHTPYPEQINIRKDFTIENRYYGSAFYIRLGLLLRKLIPYIILNLTLNNIIFGFDRMFKGWWRESGEKIREKDIEIVYGGDRLEKKKLKAYIPKDLSESFIRKVYKRSYKRYQRQIEKKGIFLETGKLISNKKKGE